jgi:hypothetical protein
MGRAYIQMEPALLLLLWLNGGCQAGAMKILLIHQNFPGQYRHMAAALQQRGDRVVAIGGPTARGLEGVELHRTNPLPAGGVPACHGWAANFQTKCLRAEAVARLLEQRAADGWRPDLVVGHPGWGELLAVKDVLPGVQVLHQVKFVYQLEGGDVGFDPEFPPQGWQTAAACASGVPASCWPFTISTGAWPPPSGRRPRHRRSFATASA